MHHTGLALASAVVFAAGCGNFGGASPSGRTIAPIGTASIDTALAPHPVRDAQGYTWAPEYSASTITGSRISAAGIGLVGTEVFLGVSPLGRIDRLGDGGAVREAELVFDPSSFAVVGSTAYASTSNALAARAGSVYGRDSLTGQWTLSRDGSSRECLIQQLGGTLYAFSGEDGGAPLGVSELAPGGAWREVAQIASTVPHAVAVLGSQLWVGGRTDRTSGGPARLHRGSGASFVEQTIPIVAAPGEALSVSALTVANGVLYVALEGTDAASGLTRRGALLGLHPVRGLVVIATLSDDAPVALAAADGTIYAGTRAGKVLWLDERLALHEEAGLPSAEAVTVLYANGGLLHAGVRTSSGARLVVRRPRGGGSSGIAIGSVAPSSGPMAGGTTVTIDGSGFANVAAVTIGGVPLVQLSVTATRITGITGAHAAGPADVVLVSPQGQATLGGGYTYQGPQLSFASDMQGLFGASGKCAACHRPGGSQASHPLTTYTQVVTGVSTAHTPPAYVVPGQPGQSLIGVLAAPGGTMAIMGQLTPAESDRLAQWILQGALP